jgi:hypothetical protein
VIEKITASFVLQHTVSELSVSMGNNPTDDLLMTMWYFEQQIPEEQQLRMQQRFMRDLYTTLQIADKCADNSVDKLIKFPLLGRALSMQAALGYQGEHNIRPGWSLTSKTAFTFQSLRLIALSLSFAFTPTGPPNQAGHQERDINKPGMC